MLFTPSAETISLEEICNQVQILSMQVGNFIRKERAQFTAAAIEEKSYNNLVSYVDRKSEELFVEGLKIILPEAGFITEEKERARASRFNWIVDPLDGTTNFIHGVPCYATSVALTENNEPVVGVIYEINLDECFYAWKNGGAWLNGKRIHCSDVLELRSSLLGTGFPYYDYGLKQQYLELFSELMEKTQGLRRPGSAATDIAYVACGRYDAFYEYGLQPWDVAAGTILVREAGGMVTGFLPDEDPLFDKRYLCAAPGIHAELQHIIKKHFTQP